MDRIEPTLSSLGVDEDTPFTYTDNNHSQIDSYKPTNLASPRRRYLGQVIDILITWLVFIVFLHASNEISLHQDYAGIISISAAFIYFVFSDALPRGQTLGKKLLSISVVHKETGNYCTLWQSFLRNVLTPILGSIDALFILTKKRQRIGDMMANTVVVKNS